MKRTHSPFSSDWRRANGSFVNSPLEDAKSHLHSVGFDCPLFTLAKTESENAARDSSHHKLRPPQGAPAAAPSFRTERSCIVADWQTQNPSGRVPLVLDLAGHHQHQWGAQPLQKNARTGHDCDLVLLANKRRICYAFARGSSNVHSYGEGYARR